MSDSSQIHRGFMAFSCHFHGAFLSASQLCRIHRGFITFMAVSWQFHIQALPGLQSKPRTSTTCRGMTYHDLFLGLHVFLSWCPSDTPSDTLLDTHECQKWTPSLDAHARLSLHGNVLAFSCIFQFVPAFVLMAVALYLKRSSHSMC